MSQAGRTALLLAALADAALALLHIAFAIVGAPAYRYFRAGEAFAAAANAGSLQPAITTLVIAAVFAAFAAYALSAAGRITPLPFTRTVLALVAFVFLARGVALLPQLAGWRLFTAGEPVAARDLLFSSVSLAVGMAHAAGLSALRGRRG